MRIRYDCTPCPLLTNWHERMPLSRDACVLHQMSSVQSSSLLYSFNISYHGNIIIAFDTHIPNLTMPPYLSYTLGAVHHSMRGPEISTAEKLRTLL